MRSIIAPVILNNSNTKLYASFLPDNSLSSVASEFVRLSLDILEEAMCLHFFDMVELTHSFGSTNDFVEHFAVVAEAVSVWEQYQGILPTH